MKLRPGTLVVLGSLTVFFGLVGCGRSDFAATPESRFVVTVNDQFKISPSQLSCKAGQAIVIHVTNTIPKTGPDIAHNLILLDSTVDADAFGQATLTAAAEYNYIPSQFLSRVLARTQLLHPGDSADLAFIAPSMPGAYPLLCAFPGHCGLGMRATLTVR